jgi:hypothetical protein
MLIRRKAALQGLETVYWTAAVLVLMINREREGEEVVVMGEEGMVGWMRAT